MARLFVDPFQLQIAGLFRPQNVINRCPLRPPQTSEFYPPLKKSQKIGSYHIFPPSTSIYPPPQKAESIENVQ